MTGIPLAPSVARYSRASSYALLLPIRRTAAASSTMRKSGALSSRNSRLALTLPTCLSKRDFVTLPWSSTTRFLERGSGVERVITRIQSPRSPRRSNIRPGRCSWQPTSCRLLSTGAGWCCSVRPPHRQHMLTLAVSPYRVKVMSKTTRDEKAAALERWADNVEPGDLIAVDASALRQLAKLTDQREALDRAITEAVHASRQANRSWSKIGAMLGVSKQAAQRKYGRHVGSA